MRGADAMAETPHVVVLGLGFAGQGALEALIDTPVQVTLIDQNDYHTFQPLLYQVATDELDRATVGFPARDMLHHHPTMLFHQTTVTGVELETKQVALKEIAPVTYDYLVVGLGAHANFFGLPGAAEHAFPLYTMEDSVRLKDHVLRLFEAVDKDPSLVDDGALTFVVIGGGPTGVELSGAIAELLRTELKEDYPNLPLEKAQVILLNHGSSLLEMFKPKLRDYAKKALEQRDVIVRLGEGATVIDHHSVTLSSGEVIQTHTPIWTAGVHANPVAQTLGVALAQGGRVPVEPDLSLAGHPEVFVVGDIALMTDDKTKKHVPQLGSTALQAGSQAGKNIARLIKGEQTEPFTYLDKGSMATVGRGAAITELPTGQTMTGHLAWMAWLGVHLALLSGEQNKSAAAVDWGWTALTHKRGKRIVVTDEDREADEDARRE
jgi:NADH dehydrogenase